MFPIYLKIIVAEGNHYAGGLDEYVYVCNSKKDFAKIGMRHGWIQKLIEPYIKLIESTVLAGGNYNQTISSYTWFKVVIIDKDTALAFDDSKHKSEIKIQADRKKEEMRIDKIRKQALAKLTPEEIEILGLSQ